LNLSDRQSVSSPSMRFAQTWICLATLLLQRRSQLRPDRAPSRSHILRISHIGLVAHDYEKSRAFYGDFLGFQKPYSLKTRTAHLL
jgi:catechol-2,3-dioxygenase